MSKSSQLVPRLALCLALAGCGPRSSFVPYDSYAEGETAVYGYVTDLYSCGLRAARVSVRTPEMQAVTDQLGRYRLRLETRSTYELVVEMEGFSPDTLRIETGPDPLRRDFLLVPACQGGDCPPSRPPCR